MTVQMDKFTKRSFEVEAIRVMPDNIVELAELCGGELRHDGEKEGNVSRDYIKVRVAFPMNEDQTRAKVGDWLVKQGRTWKIYKANSFDKQFYRTADGPGNGSQQPKKKSKNQRRNNQRPNPQSQAPAAMRPGPTPADMPKKRAESVDIDRLVDERVEEVIARKIAEGKLPLANPADIVSPTDPFKIPTAPTAETVPEGEPLLTTAPDYPEEQRAADVAAADAVQNESPAGRPITLDELNAQTGDTRSADDIQRESIDQMEAQAQQQRAE